MSVLDFSRRSVVPAVEYGFAAVVVDGVVLDYSTGAVVLADEYGFAADVFAGTVPDYSTAAVVVEADECGLAAVIFGGAVLDYSTTAVVQADDYGFPLVVVAGSVLDYSTAPNIQVDEYDFAAVVVAGVVPDYSTAAAVVVKADEYGLPTFVVAGVVLDFSTAAVVQADEYGFVAVVVAGAVLDYSTAAVVLADDYGFAADVVAGAVPDYSTVTVVVEADEYCLAAVIFVGVVLDYSTTAIVQADDYGFAPIVVDGSVLDYSTTPIMQADEYVFAVVVVAGAVPDCSTATAVVVKADEYGLPAFVVAGVVLDFSTAAVVQADEYGFAADIVAGAVPDYSTAAVVVEADEYSLAAVIVGGAVLDYSKTAVFQADDYGFAPVVVAGSVLDYSTAPIIQADEYYAGGKKVGGVTTGNRYDILEQDDTVKADSLLTPIQATAKTNNLDKANEGDRLTPAPLSSNNIHFNYVTLKDGAATRTDEELLSNLEIHYVDKGSRSDGQQQDEEEEEDTDESDEEQINGLNNTADENVGPVAEVVKAPKHKRKSPPKVKRGPGRPRKERVDEDPPNTIRPQILVLLEPKQHFSKIARVAQKIGFKNYLCGDSINPYIWVFWRDEVILQLIDIHDQCITVEVCLPNFFTGKLSFIYAKCNRVERVPLWEYLTAFSNTLAEPWILGGDFNVIKTLEEKKGGSNTHFLGMQEFNEFLVAAGLTDAGFVGNMFTWSNNQRGRNCIWQRIDRMLLNAEAIASCSIMVTHLPRIVSDHSPLITKFGKMQPRKSRFYFQKVWLEHQEFDTFVSSTWQQASVVGKHTFEGKLGYLRSALKEWNWGTFGKIEDNISAMQARIEELEQRLAHDWNEGLLLECQKVKEDLKQQLKWEHEMLASKARIKWIEDGDRNTRYFHASIKERRKKNIISLKQEDGTFTSDGRIIGEKTVEYFSELFHASPYHLDSDLFSNVEARVTSDMNLRLIAIPDEAEVLQAIKELSPDSAPGQDGFTGYFYSYCWHIIKNDLMQTITGFFCGDHLSKEQTGFLKDRSIHESIAIAQELVSDIDRKVEGGNLIFKFDMSKAYDRLEWRFLLKAMQALGFSHQVQNRLTGWQTKFLSFGGRITLVQSVLSSLPTHTLSSTVVPSQTLIRMERLFRKFLWGKIEGPGINWVSWEKICRPKAEGGLGFRSLIDMKNILAAKLAWRVLEGKSLWARFARAKYGDKFSTPAPLHSTIIWRNLHVHFQILDSHCRWIVGKGHIDFWRDRWCEGDAKLQPDLYKSFLTNEQQQLFDLILMDDSSQDQLIFTESLSEKFSVAAYWELIRTKCPVVRFTKNLWHPKIPLNIGAFFWILSYGAIPVDLALRKRGCTSPSKCRCCASPHQECLTHLFAQSEVAQGVWKYYAMIWHKPYTYGSMQQLVHTWTDGHSVNTQDGMTALGIIMFGCWEIWKSRCCAIFEDTPMNTVTIIRNMAPYLTA
ncbi:PREDICTED: uncharacterized protein LOC105953522 [Erythranthe guttata]|uniref:uncharacterized protein LOC105953522 n=1 Tax=Erythranthe guttata TaxID=4155 RepID=UPI00064DD6E2|nr:PREDICTED: uncharacterized protein LOC105953522 [Erythranthe guttata]|eukprot:XP_012832647.1 PREDICTED: uncharacterized protein LOC105953522 [Erythranthe guttata]